jgi:hypothetical protein
MAGVIRRRLSGYGVTSRPRLELQIGKRRLKIRGQAKCFQASLC